MALAGRLPSDRLGRLLTPGAHPLQNLVFVSLLSAAYGVVARLRWALGIREIADRLGLKSGGTRPYLYALAATGLEIPLASCASRWMGSFKGSMIRPYVQAAPTASVIGAAVTFALVTTGFPEELLFRGLIGGALLRHLSFWKANLVQAVLFLLPHLLLLLVAPQFWFFLAVPFVMGLYLGWLRHTSGSIWPGVIVHAGGNLGSALAVMDWSWN